MRRLAVITTHPIQYYAPWFRQISNQLNGAFRVFYLWDFGITDQVDPSFQQALRWDLPLLEGYESEIVPNCSRRPGTDHFWGIDNPNLGQRLREWQPTAILCLGYNYATMVRLLLRRQVGHVPLLLRGDSHRLIKRRGFSAWLKKQILTALFRRFAAFLYVGKANRDYLQQHGATDQQLFFSPHAVDNDRFRANAEQVEKEGAAWKQLLGIPANKRVILFAGKFQEKNAHSISWRRSATFLYPIPYYYSWALDRSRPPCAPRRSAIQMFFLPRFKTRRSCPVPTPLATCSFCPAMERAKPGACALMK